MNDYDYACWKGTAGPGAELKDMLQQEREKQAQMAAATTPAIDLKKQTIDRDVLDIIVAGSWTSDGLGFVMPQMDRKLYEKTAKVLKACGGKWNRKAQATLFEDEDAVQSLLEAVETGVYVDLKKAFQQFDTPDEIANLMMAEMQLRGQELLTFLEPSAGTGQLIRAVARHTDEELLNDAEVTAVELDDARAGRLLATMCGSPSQVCQRVVHGDFLNLTPKTIGTFDRIIMNPPFTKSQDMAHVRHARQFLKPHGILVAIMSPGFLFRQDTTAVQFRQDMIAVPWPYSALSHCVLPEGAFKTAGTNVRAVMVRIEHRGGSGLVEQ